MSAVAEWHRLLTVEPARNQASYDQFMNAIEAARDARGSVEIHGSEKCARPWTCSGGYTHRSPSFTQRTGRFPTWDGTGTMLSVTEIRDLLAAEMRRDLEVPERPKVCRPTPPQNHRSRVRTCLTHPRMIIRMRWMIWRAKREQAGPEDAAWTK